ncbi:hypothetical protein KBA73_01820 [Patescibacteria group bacterium]|nr:hypothetical protein [Patescibacteria group bacterium]
MATKVRIKTEEEQNIPEIFSRPPSALVLEERAAIEKKIKKTRPPWWVKHVPNEFAGERAFDLVKLFLAGLLFIAFHAGVCYEALIVKSGFVHGSALLLLIAYIVLPLIALISEKDWRESWLSVFGQYLLVQVPQLTYVGLFLLCLVEQYIKLRGYRNDHEIAVLEQQLTRDPVEFARNRYQGELTRVRTNLLGEHSQMQTSEKDLRQQVSDVQVQFERVKVRLDDARKKSESSRVDMLETLSRKQEARLRKLKTAIEELEGRKTRAEAFFAECEVLIRELSGVAGDELLAQEIQQSEGKDEDLISAADEVGRKLMVKLGAAFQSLSAELAEQDLKRIANVASTGSVEELVGEDFDERLAAAAARAGK